MECKYYLKSPESFVSLQSFRNNMCELSSLTDFTEKIAKEFTVYADRLDQEDGDIPRTLANEERDCNSDAAFAHKTEVPALYRMCFFNTETGRKQRMDTTNHLPTPMKSMDHCTILHHKRTRSRTKSGKISMLHIADAALH